VIRAQDMFAVGQVLLVQADRLIEVICLELSGQRICC
jgi:hypothetical protein